MANIITTRPNGLVDNTVLEDLATRILDGRETGGSFTPRSDYGWDKDIARYIVAVKNVVELDLETVTLSVVLGYLKIALMDARHEHRNGNTGCFAGYWVDNSCLYIDINQSFDNRGDAMSVAQARNELAIFDTLEEREVWVSALVG